MNNIVKREVVDLLGMHADDRRRRMLQFRTTYPRLAKRIKEELQKLVQIAGGQPPQ